MTVDELFLSPHNNVHSLCPLGAVDQVYLSPPYAVHDAGFDWHDLLRTCHVEGHMALLVHTGAAGVTREIGYAPSLMLLHRSLFGEDNIVSQVIDPLAVLMARPEVYQQAVSIVQEVSRQQRQFTEHDMPVYVNFSIPQS